MGSKTQILIDKFSVTDHLSEWLKSTEDRKLVEAAGLHDPVWGNGLKLSDVNDRRQSTRRNAHDSS